MDKRLQIRYHRKNKPDNIKEEGKKGSTYKTVPPWTRLHTLLMQGRDACEQDSGRVRELK